MNQSGIQRRVYNHREMLAARALVDWSSEPANATVRRQSAVQAAGLPPRPRTPEGGWRTAIPAGANPVNHRQQTGHHHGRHHHHHHPACARRRQQQQQLLQYQQHLQYQPAQGPVMPYNPTTITTTTTTAVVPPPAFSNAPPPHFPPMGYGGYQQWQQPQQLSPRHSGPRGGDPLDEESIVPLPPRRASHSRRR
ncbi:hypothetical protein QBC32DRAFT_315352 [Pseudoneurospora amorphoporcata]|uniref:Uncharacterized protein n=1 Tax=Pseudoneurospora amorphoporcata TaxID=241081 RepID=A0AAN6NRX3_9PEZI|nr:hypothetical protein QBC32DRAFT_315352 [Pseudoneurospora amorphoporcata]